MKSLERNTSLPERRPMEHPPPEKRPKWSFLLRMVLRGFLIWLPRLWELIEGLFGPDT